MMWHTASEPQRTALCGDAVMPSHGRLAESYGNPVYLGIGRE